MVRQVNKKRSKQRGIALVLLVILLFALLAVTSLVIDLGGLFLAKQRAQNDADAAALAGGRLLDGTSSSTSASQAEAVSIVTANNTANPNWAVDSTTVEFPTSVELPGGTVETVDLGSAISVRCEVPYTYKFARIFGADSGRAGAEATAMLRIVDSLSYPFVPWCVPESRIFDDDFPNVGEQMTLKVTDHSAEDAFIGPGNFLCLDFGSGANTYKEYVEGSNSEPFTLGIGDLVPPKPGNMPNLTQKYVQRRINSDDVFTNDDTAWDEWLATGATDGTYAETPRIIVVPVIEDPDPFGGASQDLVIAGFAAYFIESSAYDKDTGINVTGRFITATQTGEELKFGLTVIAEGEYSSLITSIRLVK